ncbi:MAG: radical SAM protein [Coriobacteriia bacterium]|nr:radical SAM protein [Coriobacteriia bacterium]
MRCETGSVCPVCLQAIPAWRVEGTDGVYLEKTCPEHGSFSTLAWSRELPFEGWEKETQGGASCCSPGELASCPDGCVDCTQHEVRPCCVLFEVTQRCNLCCPVCFASAGSAAGDDPSLKTIASWYDTLLEKAGACHIQLSGGEPTLRHDLCEIIQLGRERGFTYFQLNTNGILLAEDAGLAWRLKDAGLTCVFLQFDGISEQAGMWLRGAGILGLKKRAIDNCGAADLPVVLVPTLAKGINDAELMGVISYGISQSPVVRGVHIQPLSRIGRCGVEADRLTIPEVLALMEEQSSGMIQLSHFSGGSVEQAHCSFNANYLIDAEGRLQPLGAKQTPCCTTPVEEPSCCTPDPVTRAQDIQLRRWGTDLAAIPAEKPPSGSLDEFLWQTKARGFSITGMAFMDAFSMDFERLRRCYIFEMDQRGNLVPFCAYNLSDTQGRSLYRD